MFGSNKELEYRIKRLIKRYGPLLACGLTIATISFLMALYSVRLNGQKREIQTLQYFFDLRGERPPPQNLLIAAIDDVTYQDLQKEVSTRDKFPRIKTAQALQKISSAKPKALILDVKFPMEKDSPEADAIIEQVLKESPSTIASGALPYSEAEVLGTDKFQSITIGSDDKFTNAAKMSLNMWMSSTFGIRHSIALSRNKKLPLYEKFILLRPLKELTDLKTYTPSDYDFINFYGGQGTIIRISLSKIFDMSQAELENKFKDKVILFGYQSIARAAGTIDKEEFSVSASYKPMFGVEIHANIVGNYLDGSFIKRSPPKDEFLFIFLVVLFLSGIGLLLKPEKTIPLLVVFAIGYSVFAYKMFAIQQYWVPGVATIGLAVLIICIANSLWHYKYMKKISKVWEKAFSFELEDDEK